MSSMPLAELVSPNLHVILIHYPLGMLVTGVLIELFAFLWPRSSVRTGAKWLIALGALTAVPAALSGIYALRSVARLDMTVDRTWADTRAASPVLSDPLIWHQMRTHLLYESISAGLAAVAVVVWLGCSDRTRRTLHAPVLAVLVLSIAGMGIGAWYSGESIYEHGTGVNRGWPAATATPAPTRIEGLFPPVELHVIAAGATFALALAAVGLSFRKLALTTAPYEPAHDDGSHDLARTFNPNVEVSAGVPAMFPAARYWVLVFAVAAGTSLGGWFVLARGASVLTTAHGRYGQVPKLLWEQVKPIPPDKVNRLLVHLVTGGAIILVPLVLAGLARWAPRQRVVLSVVTGVLIAAVAAQVWFGVLLLYDTPDGPINHFNAPAAEASPAT